MAIVKTYEEFIGDETVDSLKKKAEETQQKDDVKTFTDPVSQALISGSGEEDADGSGGEMGSDV